ncbi:MAG: hypothetical protein ACOYKD_10245 [Anaerolineaceae bacterium]|jgi:hypothetical protein
MRDGSEAGRKEKMTILMTVTSKSLPNALISLDVIESDDVILMANGKQIDMGWFMDHPEIVFNGGFIGELKILLNEFRAALSRLRRSLLEDDQYVNVLANQESQLSELINQSERESANTGFPSYVG